MAQEFIFKLAFEDFDLGLLPSPPPAIGSDEFKAKVTEFFANQFRGFGGKARVVIDDAEQQIEVAWTKDSQWQDPKAKAFSLLADGRVREALPILHTLSLKNPADTEVLYHLGICYSELGYFDRAAELLERLVETEPDHVNGLVGLGVAEISRGNLLIGEQWLRQALKLEPDNRWALRNLSASLMKQMRFEEALEAIQQCLSVAPDDTAMMVAYGDCLEKLGRGDESSIHYRMAIKTGGPEHITDLAKSRLSKKSEEVLRQKDEVRVDVVQFIKEALIRFQSMKLEEVQGLALEIAMLGSTGLDINDSSKQYTINSLAGEHSGLKLLSIMYAAFQQFAPDTDLGIDLGREYDLAKATLS